VKINELHSWELSCLQAREIREQLEEQMVTSSKTINPWLIAGVDVSSNRFSNEGIAAVVVFD